jgi:hypothetical protein
MYAEAVPKINQMEKLYIKYLLSEYSLTVLMIYFACFNLFDGVKFIKLIYLIIGSLSKGTRPVQS